MTKKETIKCINQLIKKYKNYLKTGFGGDEIGMSLHCPFCIITTHQCDLCPNGSGDNGSGDKYNKCIRLKSYPSGLKSFKQFELKVANRIEVLEAWKAKINNTKGRFNLHALQQLQYDVDKSI